MRCCGCGRTRRPRARRPRRRRAARRLTRPAPPAPPARRAGLRRWRAGTARTSSCAWSASTCARCCSWPCWASSCTRRAPARRALRAARPAALLGRAPHAGGCGCLCMAFLLPGLQRREPRPGRSAGAPVVLTQVLDSVCSPHASHPAAAPRRRLPSALCWPSQQRPMHLDLTCARGAALAEHGSITLRSCHVEHTYPLRRAEGGYLTP